MLLDALVAAILGDAQMLRSWEFPGDAAFANLLRAPVDGEGHNRRRQHFTRKRIFRPLERPNVDGQEREIIRRSDSSQMGLAEAIVLNDDLLARVTSRQRTIIEKKAEGFSNVEIAAKLGIHRETVGEDLKRAMRQARTILRADG